MTGDVTLTQGSRTVTLYVTDIIRTITKKWIMTPIATTANRRGDTITDGALTAGGTSVTVFDGSDFQAKDTISIFGDSSSTFNQEIQTIASKSGNTLTLSDGLQNSYDTGAAVTKLTRFITLDLSNLQWTIDINGTLSQSTQQNIRTVSSDLEAMAYSGGTVKVKFTEGCGSCGDFQDAAITSVSIIEEAKEDSYNLKVKLKLNITGKETSSG